jgi:BT1 family
MLGSFMTFAGILAYKYLFFGASWRRIYFWSMVLTTFFSLMQLVLVFQINKTYLHLSNYLFSLGDDVISAYISGIQFLPMCIMYMSLCPEGAEGSSYAMLTTFGNIALVCASGIGNILSDVW